MSDSEVNQFEVNQSEVNRFEEDKQMEVFIFLAYDSMTKTWYYLHEVKHLEKYENMRSMIDSHLLDALDFYHMTQPKDKLVVYSLYGGKLVSQINKFKTKVTVVSKKIVANTIFTEIYIKDAYEQALQTFYAVNFQNGKFSQQIPSIVFYYGKNETCGSYFFEHMALPTNFKSFPGTIHSPKINYEMSDS